MIPVTFALSYNDLHQINYCTIKKVLGPTTDFPTWGSGKETENPQGIWLWRPVGDVITELTQDWGNRLSEGTNKTLCVPGPRRKEQWPHKGLTQTFLWVSRSLLQRYGSVVACCKVGVTECGRVCIGPFERGWHYLHYLPQSLVSGQKQGGNTVPPMNRKLD